PSSTHCPYTTLFRSRVPGQTRPTSNDIHDHDRDDRQGHDMAIKDQAMSFAKKFKLTSHHAIERFGILFGIFAITGALVIGGSGAAAMKAGSDALAHTALYTPTFTTSKTDLSGDVDGVYTNKTGDKALVMMHFGD